MENEKIISKSPDNCQEMALKTARSLLEHMGFENAEFKLVDGVPKEDDSFSLVLNTNEDVNILIGKNGQNLSALEHLVRVLTFKKLSSAAERQTEIVMPNIGLDINDYRKSRANYLIDLAKTTARRVLETRKAEALLPMNSYERKLVHTELASFENLQTESVGQEPRRRIVIKPQTEAF